MDCNELKILHEMVFEEKITALKFSPIGKTLICATIKGQVLFLDGRTFRAIEDWSIRKSGTPIYIIEYYNEDLVAVADTSRCVHIFSKAGQGYWNNCSKYRSHKGQIVQVLFIISCSSYPWLFSIGKDNKLIEYHFSGDVIKDGLEIVSRTSVGDPNPTAIAEMSTENENFLLIANFIGKIKIINAKTKMCRKIVDLSLEINSIKVLVNYLIILAISNIINTFFQPFRVASRSVQDEQNILAMACKDRIVLVEVDEDSLDFNLRKKIFGGPMKTTSYGQLFQNPTKSSRL